jgi:hypothetical protein
VGLEDAAPEHDPNGARQSSLAPRGSGLAFSLEYRRI